MKSNIKNVSKHSNAKAKEAVAKAVEAQRAAQMNAEREAAARAMEAEREAERAAIVADPDKIRVFVDDNQRTHREDTAETLLKIANDCVLPLLQDFEIEADPAQMLQWCRDTNGLKSAVISKEVGKYSKPDDPYYSDYIRTKVSAQLEKYELERYAGDAATAKFLIYDSEAAQFAVDYAAIEESCAVYVTGKAAANWRKLIEATKLLNDVFNGAAPMYVNQLWANANGVLQLIPEVSNSMAFKAWAL